MACYLRSRDDDTKLSRLFYDCTKNAENAESEESCLLSQFPAHTLSAAVSHISYFLVHLITAQHHWVYSVFLQVCPPGPGLYNCITILSLANSVWIPRMLNEGVSRLMVSVGRLRGREGVELWQHWQNMTRLQSWGHTAQRQILLMTERSRWQNTYDETIEATWRNLLCSYRVSQKKRWLVFKCP